MHERPVASLQPPDRVVRVQADDQAVPERPRRLEHRYVASVQEVEAPSGGDDCSARRPDSFDKCVSILARSLELPRPCLGRVGGRTPGADEGRRARDSFGDSIPKPAAVRESTRDRGCEAVPCATAIPVRAGGGKENARTVAEGERGALRSERDGYRFGSPPSRKSAAALHGGAELIALHLGNQALRLGAVRGGESRTRYWLGSEGMWVPDEGSMPSCHGA